MNNHANVYFWAIALFSTPLFAAVPQRLLSDSQQCPIAVDCSSVPSGQNVPIPILQYCNNGQYCTCSNGVASIQQCPTQASWYLYAPRMLLDAQITLKCVFNSEFDCASWIASITTAPPPTTSTAPAPTTSTPPVETGGRALPVQTTSAPSAPTTSAAATTAAAQSDCPVAASCEGKPLNSNVAIPIESYCEDGYYCQCGAGGATLQRCATAASWYPFAPRMRLDAVTTLQCVPQNQFDCASWISSLSS